MTHHTRVDELEKNLRDTVNIKKIQYRLTRDTRLWHQLCSSMDAIGDTNIAISAYLNFHPVQDIGCRYLIAYGLLQVLFVQQDAVQHAAEAIGISYEFPKDLKYIRKIRNEAIGHPTKKGWNENTNSFGISRISLCHEGFTLYSFDQDHADNFKPIRFQDLISEQTTAVSQAIEQMILHLRSE